MSWCRCMAASDSALISTGIDIISMGLPSGLAGAHEVEYAPYQLCSRKTVVHRTHHDEKHPSHVMLPVIPLK